MKKFTKLLGIVLIMALVMSMGTAAFAASITINPGEDSTGTNNTGYTYYEILKASIDGDKVAYYLPVSEEGTALKDLLAAVTYTKTVDEEEVTVTPFSFTKSGDGTRWNAVISDKVADGDGALLAAALNTSAIKTAALASNDFTQGESNAKAEGLDAGYYLITSTLGTELVLQTLNDVTITTKNQYVTDKKKVEKSNYNVGDYVKYTITVTLPATVDYAQPVTVHDTMDNVLSLVTATSGDHAWSAVVGEDTFTSNVTLSTGKTDKHDSSNHGVGENQVGYDFVLDISSLAPATGETASQKVVTITYYAEVTSAAAADTGYINKEFTEYSDYETKPNQVKVETFDFDLTKTFTGNTNKALEATFNLYAEVTTTETNSDGTETSSTAKATTPIKFIDGGTINGKDVTYVKVDSNDGDGSADIKVQVDATNKSLVTNVRGLEAGKYYLTETATAEGYNMLTEDVVITIDDEGTVTYSGAASGSGVINVVNNAGTVLPSTGGIGTTIFYVVGSILVVAAGVLLITKKRMSREG